ncbi:MAG: endonuclease domain-containing protein [Bacteroidota bacterium]
MKPPIIPYNPKLKERAKWLRKNMTLAEVLLWKRVKGKQLLGYDFDRQKPLDEFIVDFYCRELRLAIEVDGRSHDQKGAFEKDQYRQERLEFLGVRFLRFRDYEVLKDIENVLSRIEGWILENN